LATKGRPDSPEDIKNMANTSSAKKAVRKIDRRTVVNRARRSRMRTFVRKVEEAIASGDAALAAAALQNAAPEMMRAAQKGVIHKNTASRKVSRLTASVKALAAAK
jgi:small subunit ribosomal protein S20